MSCCGQRRREARAPTRNDASGLAVEYRAVHDGPVEFVGLTGRLYVFSAATPIQTMLPRDARELLRTGRFRLL